MLNQRCKRKTDPEFWLQKKLPEVVSVKPMISHNIIYENYEKAVERFCSLDDSPELTFVKV